MGEATRRRRAGKIKRVQSMDDYRVPEGQIALTLDIHGITDAVTVAIPVEQLDQVIHAYDPVDPEGKARAGDWDLYWKLRWSLITHMRQVFCTREEPLEGVALYGFWCVFNHPGAGAGLRRDVSEMLRHTGRAHITLSCDARETVVVVLDEAFVDTSEITADIEPDPSERFSIWPEDESVPTPQH